MFRTVDAHGNAKYSGRSKAKVVDNRDPLNRGRIRVQHPLIDSNIWIDYLRSPGQFSVPFIGELVFLEAETGSPEYPIAWGNLTKGLDENPDIPQQFKRDIPTNRGLYTPKGHIVELDDGVATPSNAPIDNNLTTKNRGIRVTSSADNKIHIIEDTEAGNQYILIQDAGGNLIKMDYKNNQLTINSIGATKIDTATDKTETVGGNETQNVTGNKSETIGGDLTITVTGNVTIQCAEATIESSGNTNVTAGGNAVITASSIELNGSSGQILTTTTDPVVDSIFGIPTVGVPTVTSG